MELENINNFCIYLKSDELNSSRISWKYLKYSRQSYDLLMKLRYQTWYSIGSRWARWDSIESYCRWIRSNRAPFVSNQALRVAIVSDQSYPLIGERSKGVIACRYKYRYIGFESIPLSIVIRLRLVEPRSLCNRSTNDENKSSLSIDPSIKYNSMNYTIDIDVCRPSLRIKNFFIENSLKHSFAFTSCNR